MHFRSQRNGTSRSGALGNPARRGIATASRAPQECESTQRALEDSFDIATFKLSLEVDRPRRSRTRKCAASGALPTFALEIVKVTKLVTFKLTLRQGELLARPTALQPQNDFLNNLALTAVAWLFG